MAEICFLCSYYRYKLRLAELEKEVQKLRQAVATAERKAERRKARAKRVSVVCGCSRLPMLPVTT